MHTRQNLAVSLVLAISMVGVSYGASGVLPGDGLSESTAYLIEDLADFDVFADPANAATYWSSGVYTKLTCDPNLTGRPYTTAVIAPDTPDTSGYFDGIPFAGVFDGNGHIISNLTIDTAGAGNDYLGLFGRIKDFSAEVKNLGIENINITGGDDSGVLGGLCGDNYYGTITNCYAAGPVTGGYDSDRLGGLCGYNSSTITNCYATGSVTGGNDSRDLGGLCGRNRGAITNCYATGPVTGGAYADYLGGLCGCNIGTITDCYAAGAVTGGAGSYDLGGLCGKNDDCASIITNCYATGPVTGRSHLGGLCGNNYYGTITNCYATGSVIGGFDSHSLGGLCGYNYYGTITNSYATGSVIGGAGSYDLGGLCGYNVYGTISNNFWDTETSGMTVGYNLDPNNPGTITNVIGKTTNQMQTESTFTDASWDFTVVPVWHMPFQVVGYPMLGWQKDISGDFTGRYGVYMDDFAVLSNAWLSVNTPTANWNEHCDLNDSGSIDPGDLIIFAENWLCK